VVTTTKPQACPWCETTTGFRDLTYPEVLRSLPLTVVQSAISGVVHFKDPKILLSAAATPVANTKCLDCCRLVRECPNCDRPYRVVNGLAIQCATCATIFI
jgi:hypothetical protein